MDNEQLKQLYSEMEEWYGTTLPDPEHEPLQFSYIVKLFLYFRDKKQ